jgi:conjugal transfer pilus assembly protein TraK
MRGKLKMNKKLISSVIAGLVLFSSFSVLAENICSNTNQPYKGSICEQLNQRQESLRKQQEEQIFKTKSGGSLELNKKNNLPANVPQMNYKPEPVFQKEEKRDSAKKNSGFYFKIPKDAVEAEELSGSAFIVKPEKTTVVRMSASDINRIVCTEAKSEIKVVYPQRKGVVVKSIDSNAFVEFEVKKVGNQYIYQETPTELYVMCDNTVYTLIAVPQKIPAVTVYLENRAKALQEKLEALSGIPYEKRIIEIVKTLFSGKAPYDAQYLKVSKEYNVYPALKIKETGNYIFDADGLIARVFSVSLKEEAKENFVDLREKDFLRKEITVYPSAVAINKLKVFKGEKVMVVIVEKRNVITESKPFYFMGGER